MKLYDVLINENNSRLSVGNKWLICQDGDPFIEYPVLNRKPWAEEAKILYKGTNENKACEILISN